MRVSPGAILVVFLALTLLTVGCTDGDAGGSASNAPAPASRTSQDAPVEVWALSDTPLLQIGVREGEDPYQLYRVRGSVLLENAQLVVLNSGSRELRYFDADGRYLRAVGGEGEGPGEFQYPTKLRKTADGGLRVWDQGLMRLSRFDLDGTYRDMERLIASRQEMFPGDDWILGANWVVSPVEPGARGPIREAVEALPQPDSVATLRIVWVTPQGRIWIPDQRTPAETPVSWQVFDLDGRQVARITTPAHFQPHEIGEDYLTGLFLDDLDVNYVRVYEIQKPSGSPPGPGLERVASAGSPQAAQPVPHPPDEIMAGIRSLMKNMASLEEIYYSEHYTYTADMDALFSDPRASKPKDLAVDIYFAGPEGWAAQVSHPESGGRCIMAYGFFVAEGWQPGAVVCI